MRILSRPFCRPILAAAALAVLGTLILPAPGASAATPPRTVLFVVDTSGSMTGAPLVEAKTALNAAVDTLPADDQAGLRSYGGNCGNAGSLLVPPGAGNREAVRSAVSGLTARGNTPTPDALRAAVADFPGTGEKLLVLVSDGQSTCGDPCPVAQESKAALGVNFQAYTVGFNANQQAAGELRCIAESTGGRYFEASDTKSLQDALQSIVEEPQEPVDTNCANLQQDLAAARQFAESAAAQLADLREGRAVAARRIEQLNGEITPLAAQYSQLFDEAQSVGEEIRRREKIISDQRTAEEQARRAIAEAELVYRQAEAEIEEFLTESLLESSFPRVRTLIVDTSRNAQQVGRDLDRVRRLIQANANPDRRAAAFIVLSRDVGLLFASLRRLSSFLDVAELAVVAGQVVTATTRVYLAISRNEFLERAAGEARSNLLTLRQQRATAEKNRDEVGARLTELTSARSDAQRQVDEADRGEAGLAARVDRTRADVTLLEEQLTTCSAG